jgi:hypothetical protein
MFLVRTAYYKYIILEDKMSSIAQHEQLYPHCYRDAVKGEFSCSSVDQQIIGFIGKGGIELDNVVRS